MHGRNRVGTALALCLWAGAADAATWVRYSFTGAGTALYLGPSAPLGQTRSVSFAGQAYVDLDAHAVDWALGQPWYSDGGTSFASYATLGGTPATATAGRATLGLAISDVGIGGGFQNWAVAALLPGVLGTDGRFPVFPGTQAVTGDVLFGIGNSRSSYTGTGRLSALSMEQVAGPGSWVLSVSPGPIPEPGTWATVLLGFALLGGGLRYRRRAPRVAFD